MGGMCVCWFYGINSVFLTAYSFLFVRTSVRCMFKAKSHLQLNDWLNCITNHPTSLIDTKESITAKAICTRLWYAIETTILLWYHYELTKKKTAPTRTSEQIPMQFIRYIWNKHPSQHKVNKHKVKKSKTIK